MNGTRRPSLYRAPFLVILPFIVGMSVAPAAAEPVPGSADFKAVQGFLSKHCLSCHVGL